MSRRPASILMPDLENLTEHERAWIGFLRLISDDSDPSPTLQRVQALRHALSLDTPPGKVP